MTKYEIQLNDHELNIKALSIQHSIIDCMLPIIANNDKGHGWVHSVETAQLAININEWFNIYPNNLDVVVVSLLHDIGLIAGRSRHHEVGALMLEEGHYKKWFDKLITLYNLNKKNIINAIREHRASATNKFYSPLSRLISMSDRGEPDLKIVVRRLKDIGNDIRFVIRHIKEKYSSSGYIKYDPLYIEYFGEQFNEFMSDCDDIDLIISTFKNC